MFTKFAAIIRALMPPILYAALRSALKDMGPDPLPKISERHFIGDEDIALTQPGVEEAGSVKIGELAAINGIIRVLKPQAIFEFGTYQGRTALNFALNSPENCRIFTLDLPLELKQELATSLLERDRLFASNKNVGFLFSNSLKEYSRKITQLSGDSRVYDFSEYVGEIDFVFIDGSHLEEDVVTDSINACEMVRARRGVIAWHDYSPASDVARALVTFEERIGRSGSIFHLEHGHVALMDFGQLGLNPEAVDFSTDREMNHWKNSLSS
jgi:predicted O-methyltransferase YrrM